MILGNNKLTVRSMLYRSPPSHSRAHGARRRSPSPAASRRGLGREAGRSHPTVQRDGLAQPHQREVVLHALLVILVVHHDVGHGNSLFLGGVG